MTITRHGFTLAIAVVCLLGAACDGDDPEDDDDITDDDDDDDVTDDDDDSSAGTAPDLVFDPDPVYISMPVACEQATEGSC